MNPRLRVLPIPVALILALATWGYSRAANRINPVQEGKYGTDYIFRAATAFVGLGASLPQDAIYPLATTDGNGQRLDGANMYVLHFKKGKLPPVNGFWSLSMNDAEYFFVENALNRYTLSERNTFNLNPDGSVDLYLQHEPSDKEAASELAAGARRQLRPYPSNVLA